MEIISRMIKRYWPIKNFSTTLEDTTIKAYQDESADGFYEQLGRIHERIMTKPDIAKDP